MTAKAGFDAARYLPVLETGLPVLPDRVSPGEPVPVAMWTGPRFGAVYAIEDCPHDPYCGTDEHYVATHYTYRRGPDGWELPDGSGSDDWPGGTSTKTSLAPREVRSDSGRYGSSRSWICRMVVGCAGSDARWVELQEGGDTIRRPISDTGAFVVVLDGDGPAVVHVLDQEERPLYTRIFESTEDEERSTPH
jgi:hypothetical protein